jgi:SOS-response transcriptional repressor LexA
MLSPIHVRAYQHIAERLLSTGVAPSMRELALGLGASRDTAHAAVTALEAHGFIRRLPGKARAIGLVRVEYFRFDEATKELVPWAPSGGEHG